MTEIIDYNIDSAENSEDVTGEEDSVFIVDGENDKEEVKDEHYIEEGLKFIDCR